MRWTCCPSNFSLVALVPGFLAGRRDFAVEPLIDRNHAKEELCCGNCCSTPYPSWLNMTLISPQGRFCTVNLPCSTPATGCRSCRSSPAGVFSGRDSPWPRFVTSASPKSGPPGVFCTNPHRAGECPALVAEEEGGSVTCTGLRPVLKASREGGGLGTLKQPSRGDFHLAVGVGGNRSRARTNVPSILVIDIVKAPPNLPTRARMRG